MSFKDWFITIFVLIPLGLLALLYVFAILPGLFTLISYAALAALLGFLAASGCISVYEGYERAKLRMSYDQYNKYKHNRRG